MKGIFYTVLAALLAFAAMFFLTFTSQSEELSLAPGSAPAPQKSEQTLGQEGLSLKNPKAHETNSANPDAMALSPDFVARKNSYLKSSENEEFEKAISEIEALIRDYPKVSGLIKDLATTLYASAVKDFEKGEYEKTIDKLRRSAALGNKVARLALARVLVLKGQTSEAVSILEEHFNSTKDQKTLESLIDLSLTLGLYTDAERQLLLYDEQFIRKKSTQKTENDQKHPSEEFFSSRTRKLAKRKQLDSQKYSLSRDEIEIVYFQKEAETLAEKILTTATATVDSLKAKFGSVNLGAGFNIELVQEKGFGELTGAPPWAGAIFDGTIRIPYSSEFIALGSDFTRLRRMTQHEATHAFLYSICGDRVPSWMGEGLAQIQEGRNPRSAAESLQMLARDSWKKLESADDLDQSFVQVSSAEKVRVLYLRSLLLVGELERVYGVSIWKRFFLQMCTNEIPYQETLESIFAERTSSELWQRMISNYKL